MINCYTSWHPKSFMICKAFAQGCRAPVVGPSPLLEGDVFMYGCLRGLLPTLKAAQKQKRTWFYADNQYLGTPKRYYGQPKRYYRITRNAWQHNGAGKAGPERWRKLRLKIRPWRTSGEHVLVCPPEPLATELWGVAPDWEQKTVAELQRHTDRPIVVRRRVGSQLMDGAPPLASALKDCWAVVVWRSNVAVDALLAGVPVFCTDLCAGHAMGQPELSCIEDPYLPDERDQFFWNLAANQWTLAEMSDGTCWRDLNDGRYQ